jgi:hypothetical protein
MTEQICPNCGCVIVPGKAYEGGGTLYCCEPCATGGQCTCGCCEQVEEEED